MSHCPVCHASVQDDFGLIECSGCSAQLMVHIDGRVEYQGAEELPEQEGLGFTSAKAVDAVSGDLGDLGDIEELNPPPLDFVPPEPDGTSSRMPEDDPIKPALIEEDPPFDPTEPSADFMPEPEPESESEAEPEAEAEIFFDGEDEPGEPVGAIYNSADQPNSPDLTDVARFGNSDISGGRDGPLRYNLFIEGIDTSDVRQAFREALTDRKLMWDTDQILRSIRNGRVSISNIAPTKAYILISRLRGMPVQVRWEQYAISQT